MNFYLTSFVFGTVVLYVNEIYQNLKVMLDFIDHMCAIDA